MTMQVLVPHRTDRPEQQHTITMAKDGAASAATVAASAATVAAIMSSPMPDPIGVVDSLDEELYDDPSLLMPSETSDADDSLTEAATLDYSLPPATKKAEPNGPEKAEADASNTTANNNNHVTPAATAEVNNNNPTNPHPSISLLDNDDETNNNNNNFMDVGASNDDDTFDTFDPFQIESTAKTKRRSSRLSKLFGSGSGNSKTSENKNNSNGASSKNKGVMLLPPRLEVKFKVSEEVTSHPSFTNPNEGACDVRVTGTVYAQQASSDALKNSPFVLISSSLNTENNINFMPNEEYCKLYATQAGQEASNINVIKIPKSSKQTGYVFIGKYTIVETVDHMPLLLEKKVTKAGNKIQMAFQVRSKLSNLDDLNDISLAVSLDDHVIGDSVALTSGNGTWDRSKRAIVWKLSTLPKGESFMVTARARVTLDAGALQAEQLHFPVMMRCSSQDQISTVHLQAIEASGYPATISHSTASKAFRLIHRLN